MVLFRPPTLAAIPMGLEAEYFACRPTSRTKALMAVLYIKHHARSLTVGSFCHELRNVSLIVMLGKYVIVFTVPVFRYYHMSFVLPYAVHSIGHDLFSAALELTADHGGLYAPS